MQKIAFHLNSLQQGGAERVVSNLANRFAKEGYEVVIATEWYGTDEFALDQKVRRVHVGLTKEDENRSRISKMLRRIWYLRRAACSRQRAQKPFLHRIYRKIPELF